MPSIIQSFLLVLTFSAVSTQAGDSIQSEVKFPLSEDSISLSPEELLTLEDELNIPLEEPLESSELMSVDEITEALDLGYFDLDSKLDNLEPGLERRRGPGYRRGPRRGPRRGGFRRGFRGGRVVCFSENLRGQVFRSSGRVPHIVQQRALDRCFSRSLRCFSQGCRFGF